MGYDQPSSQAAGGGALASCLTAECGDRWQRAWDRALPSEYQRGGKSAPSTIIYVAGCLGSTQQPRIPSLAGASVPNVRDLPVFWLTQAALPAAALVKRANER